MMKSQRRISVLQGHLHVNTSLCSNESPQLAVNPSTCLVDEKIHISLSGLGGNQIVTLTCCVDENGIRFESRGVYQAGKDGKIDNKSDPCLAGTFTNVDQMGLFWSLKATPGQKPGARLIKKDVTTPLKCIIKVYDGIHPGDAEIRQAPLTTATVLRYYKSATVHRIPVTEGPYRGTIFVPQGKGPFPSLVDLYGGLVSLVENRAALLASHGYATFASSYLYQVEKQQLTGIIETSYIKHVVEWFSKQDYVDENRVGMVGLCYGGFLSLACAAMCPKVRVVVNVNGSCLIPFTPEEDIRIGKYPDQSRCNPPWPNPELEYRTKDGIVINTIYLKDKLMAVPAWINGAKVLTIIGEDDKQCHPGTHRQFASSCPEKFRSNVEIVAYPGAGHLIEPPYSPLCSVIHPGKARMALLNFIKPEFIGEPMLAGGYPEQHAIAQEDSWHRILAFLHKHLRGKQDDKYLLKGTT